MVGECFCAELKDVFRGGELVGEERIEAEKFFEFGVGGREFFEFPGEDGFDFGDVIGDREAPHAGAGLVGIGDGTEDAAIDEPLLGGVEVGVFDFLADFQAEGGDHVGFGQAF